MWHRVTLSVVFAVLAVSCGAPEDAAPSVPRLAAALEDDDPKVRRDALKQLLEVEDLPVETRARIVRLGMDPDEAVRHEAVTALEALYDGEDETIFAMLLHVSLCDGSETNREAATEAMDRIVSSQSAESGVQALDPECQGEADLEPVAAVAVGEADSREALYLRLLEAYARQAPIHHAMKWVVPKKDGTIEHVRTELFVEGDRGLIVFLDEQDLSICSGFLVTDGDVLRMRAHGRDYPVSAGARVVNEALRPYREATVKLAALWGRDVPGILPFEVRPHVAPGPDTLLADLGIFQGRAPGWLCMPFLADMDLVLDEDGEHVVMSSDSVRGRLRLGTALPVVWECVSPETRNRVRGEECEPSMSMEAKQRMIDEKCGGLEPEHVELSLTQNPVFGLGALVYVLATTATSELRDVTKREQASRAVVEADALGHPFRHADGSGEGRAAAAVEHVRQRAGVARAALLQARPHVPLDHAVLDEFEAKILDEFLRASTEAVRARPGR